MYMPRWCRGRRTRRREAVLSNSRECRSRNPRLIGGGGRRRERDGDPEQGPQPGCVPKDQRGLLQPHPLRRPHHPPILPRHLLPLPLRIPFVPLPSLFFFKKKISLPFFIFFLVLVSLFLLLQFVLKKLFIVMGR